MDHDLNEALMRRSMNADRSAEIDAKLKHIADCVEVWATTGVSRERAICRTLTELRVLLPMTKL